MYNSAEYTIGLGFSFHEKGGLNYFALSNKGGFDCDPTGDVFYFFCDQYGRFPRRYGGSLHSPYLLRLAGPAKALLIAIRKLRGDLGEL